MRALHDLYWLALLIYLEARNQSDDGMLAVAWVVCTRANEKKISIQDTVMMAYQFSALNTTDPNRMKIDDAPFSPEWGRCMRAAAGAYFALSENPAPRATHYINPKVLPKLPSWYRRDAIIRAIGDHEFLRVA